MLNDRKVVFTVDLDKSLGDLDRETVIGIVRHQLWNTPLSFAIEEPEAVEPPPCTRNADCPSLDGWHAPDCLKGDA